MLLGLIGWLAIGLILGFIVSKVLDLHGDDPNLGIGVAAGSADHRRRRLYVVQRRRRERVECMEHAVCRHRRDRRPVLWHGIRSRYISRTPQTRRRSY